MKKITNLIIVDASISMLKKTSSVKEGLEGLIRDIRKDMKKTKGEAKIRTIITQFGESGNFEVIVDTKKRKNLKLDYVDSYKADGYATALFDAIGLSFNMVGKKQDGVFVSILTDGDENHSKEFTVKDVKNLLSKANKKDWGVTFMGTTKKAVEAAKTWGIKSNNTFQYADNVKGTKMANTSRNLSKTMYFSSVMEGSVKTDNLVNESESSDED